MFHYSAENPVTLLLGRRPFRILAGMGAALLAGALGVLLLPEGLEGAVLVAALVFPLAHGLLLGLSDGSAGAFLSGCWEEVQQTRLSAEEMLDGVTYATLRRLVGTAIGSAVFFGLASLLLRQPEVLLVAISAQLAGPVVGWSTSYAAQMGALQSRRGSGSFRGALAHAPGGLLLLAAFSLPGQLPYASWWLAQLVFLGMLALASVAGGLVCRAQAAGMLRGEVAHERAPARARAANPHCKPWSDNPIVVREVRREARNLGGGPIGRYGVVLLPVLLWGGLTAGVAHSSGLQGLLYSFLLLLLLLFLQPFRAASRAGGAVLDEREARTLDSLSMAGLSPQEFVDGWAQVALRPRLQESLLAVPVVMAAMAYSCARVQVQAPTGVTVSPGGLFCVATVLLLCVFLYTVVGAYLGVAASACSMRRGQLLGTLLTPMVLGGVLITAASEALAHPLAGLAWLFPIAAGALLSVGVRAFALQRVRRAGVA